MKTSTKLSMVTVAGVCAVALVVPALTAPAAESIVPTVRTPSAWVRPVSPGGSDSSPGWERGTWPQAGSSSGAGSSESGSSDSGSSGQPGAASGMQDSPATASATTQPTAAQSRGVVLINSTMPSGEGAGTGMVLTSSGQVLTNYHVVEGSTSLTATIADTGEQYRATVVGWDAARDVALIQLQDASGLATVTLDDDDLAVGDALTAVGNASGGGKLIAAPGQVTALEQQVKVSNEGKAENLSGVIATDAAAEPGDSGGPMFDHEGEVAGMTTAGGQTTTAVPGYRGRAVATTNVSYAVPIEDAMSVINQIRAGHESGTVRIGPRAYLGVSVASSSLTVASVADGGPAAGAGLTVGSTITSIDGQAVTTHDELAAALEPREPGQKVALTWLDADGVRHSATVTLGSSPVA
ncbi:MAG: trypsin-like peptidase domain-containing protein [Propioniciclava sp.]|uniref:S1C family serine protease n=1 Tax=Propioniciclava sp. TaxID=2038686 RepID=UPI0039E38389